jgi:hypothetical protein
MHQHPPTRATARSTSALAEFHGLAGHAGAADDCADCAAVLDAQRRANAAFRRHQRDLSRRVRRILGTGQ